MMARAALWLIRLYQWTLSPLLGNTCRFHPSCSHYAATCVERFGAGRGLWLSARRVARCHPFHPGGHDPAPPLRAENHVSASGLEPALSIEGPSPAHGRQ